MLDLLVKSAVRRKTVGLFVLNPDHELYARQIAKIISESPHAVGLEIKHLLKGDLLKKVTRPGRTYFKLNSNYHYTPELKSIIQKMIKERNNEITALPDLAHKERIDKTLNTVVEDIKRYYDPGKIILFGSAATGEVGPYSDIDLVIVKKTALPFFKRTQQLVDLLNYDIDIDFLIYTPEEFERALKEKRFFSEEILKKGKILYEKAA